VPGAAAIRRANLAHYLAERTGAPYLLVGEAMGYQGGRFSGMAFTSERQLSGWGPPYATSSTRPKGFAEPSATVIHGALEAAGAERRAILWNTVPAHPFRPGAPLSNRAPTVAEVAAGRPLLDAAIALLAPRLVVAVGRVAEGTLGERAAASVRHPSQGGATACRAGLAELLATTDDHPPGLERRARGLVRELTAALRAGERVGALLPDRESESFAADRFVRVRFPDDRGEAAIVGYQRFAAEAVAVVDVEVRAAAPPPFATTLRPDRICVGLTTPVAALALPRTALPGFEVEIAVDAVRAERPDLRRATLVVHPGAAPRGVAATLDLVLWTPWIGGIRWTLP
jgi:hypothetical protein